MSSKMSSTNSKDCELMFDKIRMSISMNMVAYVIHYSYYYFKRMNAERKLIQIFKSFVEKSLVPQIRKIDGQLFEWNKFSTMLSSEAINYQELQSYVDSISQSGFTGISSFQKKDQIPMFKKKKEESNELQVNDSSQGFNPSKTFGGERARMMFPLKSDSDDLVEKDKFGGGGSFNFNANIKDDQFKKQTFVNPQSILPGLQRLCKTFIQNQGRIENIVNGTGYGGGKFY